MPNAPSSAVAFQRGITMKSIMILSNLLHSLRTMTFCTALQNIQRSLALGLILIIVPTSSRATADGLPEGWFEFPMSGLDASLPDVDVSSMNHRPAAAGGFIRNENGHFVDSKGQRLRFLGTNLCFGAAFPDKADAENLAIRMAKLGINVVRFHHIDNATAPRGIWLRDQAGLDPQQLDRLDWLIAKLDEQGIYSNLNLHVSRTYPGIPNEIAESFRYGKALDNFYAPYIALQKEYARDLLSHRNPYTGRTYAADPAILCVEINNENSLTTTDWNDLADLPDPWGSELRKQWNDWLVEQYSSTQQLRERWQEVDEPLGSEMLAHSKSGVNSQDWNLEAPAPAEASLQVVPEGPRPGIGSLRAELTKPGTESWHFQLNQTGLSFDKDQVYTFSFWAKSDPPRTIHAESRMAEAPWSFLGLNRTLKLTAQWQHFTLPFQASGGRAGFCRAGWGFGNVPGRVWIAEPTLKPGGLLGTPKDQSLEQRNLALVQTHDTAQRKADYQRFLMETEHAYQSEMIRFLKNDLGLQSLLTNTQASYGGLAGVLREAALSDFVDMHGYWQHPRFPGRPWDRSNWNIPNTSMIGEADGGVPSRIAMHRVDGKPFTVSEYNHPTPNDHCAEMFPMLASQAAFQDWDGLYQFTYSHSSDDLDRPHIGSFFDMVNHPGQLVWLPIAATIFRGAAVQPGADPVALQISAQDALDLRRSMTEVWSQAGAEPGLAVTRPVTIHLGDNQPNEKLSEQVSVANGKRQSSTGQIRWHLPQRDQTKGHYLINAPQVRCAVGDLQGSPVVLDDVSFTVNQATNGWASLGLAALDGKPIEQSKKMLLVAVGRVANSDMQWNEDRTSVADHWGHEPTIAEGIGATVRLPGSFAAVALSAAGEKSQALQVKQQNGFGEIEIGPQHQTLWYLITR